MNEVPPIASGILDLYQGRVLTLTQWRFRNGEGTVATPVSPLGHRPHIGGECLSYNTALRKDIYYYIATPCDHKLPGEIRYRHGTAVPLLVNDFPYMYVVHVSIPIFSLSFTRLVNASSMEIRLLNIFCHSLLGRVRKKYVQTRLMRAQEVKKPKMANLWQEI